MDSCSRYVGIDLGAETIKAIELVARDGGLAIGRRELIDHGQAPGPRLLDLLARWDWPGVTAAAVSGRMSRLVRLPRVPTKHAQVRGYRYHFGDHPATLVSIGSHGFSVLELRANGTEVFRENSRCSQGTGNFLRQLVERFSLGIAAASELCADIENPAPLSGRCPVILKTDMTHLANKGESRAQILAGLFDAVCQNVLVLVRPGVSPANVCLLGGVSRSRRIQRTIRTTLEKNAMALVPLETDDALFMEALGAALEAAEGGTPPPLLDALLAPPVAARLERVAALATALPRVRRMPAVARAGRNGHARDLILGFDIGSTGSKLVALDASTAESAWEGYRRTLGDPVGAAQGLLRQFVEENVAGDRIVALGATGSGREIVGSLMATCYGRDAVFILNEIAAHAEGALYYDPRVDTIFEIGGQDAKYIRLAEGRVVDCAMNEACSAGTGSFIEEQGRKFKDVQDVAQLGAMALAAPCGVSLGQHCSVFMAEIIDEAVAAGVGQNEIVAGLYDSIIQNYLHRVKGNRSVGAVIFCQGMPFSADALAAAVARQTGSEVIIPPNPGTVGALGIALLTRRELPWQGGEPLDPARFLGARVESRDTFICNATTGCGGAGNKCRIDSLRTIVAGQRQRFTWGGGCALHDKGTRKTKLPDLAPDPFRERDEQLQRIAAAPTPKPNGRRVAVSDEFMLKGLFPFFAVFLRALGFELMVPAGADQSALKRGIREANIPFCAPMQLFHGLAAQMAGTACDYIFIPMIRSIPRCDGESASVACPIAQGSGDVLKWDLQKEFNQRLVSTVIDVGSGNLESIEFQAGCARVAADLGENGDRWIAAHRAGVSAQAAFEAECRKLGARAVGFCREHGIVPVVVLGRPYTIYNRVLNSNAPALLREQGAIAIPLDCYPLDADAPVFDDIYWGYSQRILRTAHVLRRTADVYSVFCSNYACGPDSFSLHFYAYIMEGKPFAIIETDGHAGDAGTKTRLEAFLHCVQQDRRAQVRTAVPNEFAAVQMPSLSFGELAPDETILIPYMGPPSEVATAAINGLGRPTEMLPPPDAASLRLGRRYTSGKECVPMCMTLGTLLRRLELEPDPKRKFAFMLPRTRGPCRLGVYNLLNRLILERLGWNDRVRIWAPCDEGYFDDMPAGFGALLFAGLMACDTLLEALLDSRPDETSPGAANEIHRRYQAELMGLLQSRAPSPRGTSNLIWEVVGGGLFGIAALLRRAGKEFAAARRPQFRPTILVVGEIYVRSVAFANDFVIEKLEARGCRVRLAPCGEWIEYSDLMAADEPGARGLTSRVNGQLQRRILERTHSIMGRALGWPERRSVDGTLAASDPYLRRALHGEAVLTLGSPLQEWRHREIDAVVCVGPLECMPNKLAEAQLFHARETTGLPSLTLSLIGDPMNVDVLDNFIFEVQAQARKRGAETARPTR